MRPNKKVERKCVFKIKKMKKELTNVKKRYLWSVTPKSASPQLRSRYMPTNK